MTYIYISPFTRLGQSDKFLEKSVTVSLYVHKFSSSLINCSLWGKNEVRTMMI